MIGEIPAVSVSSLVPFWVSVSFDIWFVCRNSYHAEVTKISYGGKQISLGITGNGLRRVVFDSGSSYTYFPKQAYNDLVANVSSSIWG